MRLEEVYKERRELTLIFGTDQLVVVYNPHAISHRELREILAKAIASEGSSQSDWVIEFLSKTLVSWDLMSEEGSDDPYPVDSDSLAALPTLFLHRVLMAVSEHMNSPGAISLLKSFSEGEAAELRRQQQPECWDMRIDSKEKP
jgi:hypothetical protein